MKNQLSGRDQRHRRVRSHLAGTSTCPRLSVFRSHTGVYAQLIDDVAGVTLLACLEQKLPSKEIPATVGSEYTDRSKEHRAFQVGWWLAQEAKKMGLSKAVFDRGGYAYHGRVKAVAEGARFGGLSF